MTKLSGRAPLAIAVALVSLALHASGCTSLLGDLPPGEASDGSVTEGSVADGGGDTSPGMDVTSEAADSGSEGGPKDSGEAGAPCGPTTCPDGCCNASGQCVAYTSQSSGTCGKGGLACGKCANGDSCSNGACSCGGTMCNGCCGTSNTCVSPTSNTQCGANGAMCQACSSDQTCNSQGECVCNAATCSGCCDPTSQHCITATNNNQCGKGGAACQACGANLECSSGACVCDSTSCSMGCCVGGTTGTCQLFGAQSGTSCGKSGATCGTCPTGQTCDGSGNCVCNAASCPHGCCNGGPTGTCEDWATQSPTSCGTGGAACGPCTNSLCDTTNGTCACDSNTCAGGCCVGGSTGTCEAYGSQSVSSCGASGASCAACSAGANACTNGVCECGTGAACSSGETCCGSTCVNLTNDPNNCGACAHSCQGSACNNGLCAPITLGQTTYHATISRAGGITVGAGNVFVSEYASSNNGYIESCPVGGCPGSPPTATAIFTDAGNAGLGQILWDPGTMNLFFGDANQGRGYGITTAGTQLFMINDGVIAGVAADATYLYVADYQGLAYLSKTSSGTVTPTRIVSTFSYTQGVTVDPNGNVWGAARNDNIVASCTRAGSCTQWTWTGGPQGVAIIGPSPYVLTQSSGFYKCASLSDCSQANATQVTSESVANFSFDPNNAYFPFGATVQVCPLSGCPSPQTLAGANGNAVATANDMTWVYWLTDTGYIQKVAK
jgi:hypothetical protein